MGTPSTIADGCTVVPPSGGSLEIGNWVESQTYRRIGNVPPSGGSLEIGNAKSTSHHHNRSFAVPPSGGSLEIGNN